MCLCRSYRKKTNCQVFCETFCLYCTHKKTAVCLSVVCEDVTCMMPIENGSVAWLWRGPWASIAAIKRAMTGPASHGRPAPPLPGYCRVVGLYMSPWGVKLVNWRRSQVGQSDRCVIIRVIHVTLPWRAMALYGLARLSARLYFGQYRSGNKSIHLSWQQNGNLRL